MVGAYIINLCIHNETDELFGLMEAHGERSIASIDTKSGYLAKLFDVRNSAKCIAISSGRFLVVHTDSFVQVAEYALSGKLIHTQDIQPWQEPEDDHKQQKQFPCSISVCPKTGKVAIGCSILPRVVILDAHLREFHIPRSLDSGGNAAFDRNGYMMILTPGCYHNSKKVYLLEPAGQEFDCMIDFEFGHHHFTPYAMALCHNGDLVVAVMERNYDSAWQPNIETSMVKFKYAVDYNPDSPYLRSF